MLKIWHTVRACEERDARFGENGMRKLLIAAFLFVVADRGRADDWPQWHGPRRDGVWRETGIVSKFPNGGPPVVWQADVGGGFAGPAVAQGRVFLMDRRGDKLPKG